MPFPEILRKINLIEKNFDVNSIKCNNILLWPIIRNTLYFNTNNTKAPVIDNSDNLKKEYNKAYLLFENYIEKLYISSDFIFQIDASIRASIKIDEVNHHKVIDSLYLLLNKDYDIVVLSNELIDSVNKRHNTQLLYRLTRLEGLISYLNKKYDIQGLSEFFIYLKSNGLFEIDYDYLYYIGIIFIVDVQNCMRILKKIKANYIFLDCYYATNFNMAFVCAANILGKKTIDIQHGIQLKSHHAYANFNVIPKIGYQSLPNYFLVWHQNEEQNINRWALNTVSHKAIVSGHIFYTYYKEFIVKKNIHNIGKKYPSNKINILVTLGRDDNYSKEITKAVNLSNDNIVWHFREHPAHNFDVYNKLIKDNVLSVKNIEYDFSTNINLYDLFPFIDIHITDYSTVSYELIDFEKVPTIYTYWSESFQEVEGFYYASSATEILDTIHFININFDNIKNSMEAKYTCTGIDLINNAINCVKENKNDR